MEIPVVDFGVFSMDKKHVRDDQLQDLGKELKRAFTEVGFVFLKNFGISEQEVDRVMNISREFFLQPDEVKQPFRRTTFPQSANHGWVSMLTESLNPRRPGDLKETYNITTLNPDIKWPSSGALKDFQEIQTSFFQRCKELSLRVLRVIAISLDLDPNIFLGVHQLIGSDGNNTTLRSLYYPPLKSEEVLEGQIRCGEHSDYGSITLLFQNSDGLQVRTHSGDFIAVPTIPGAVLINIADLMQRWTSDHLVSAVHRVLLPPVGDTSTRQSLAFFVHPDDEALITCYDGLNKYPPVTAGDYLVERFNGSYGK